MPGYTDQREARAFKARCLADAFQDVGIDSALAATLPPATWRLAARVAWHIAPADHRPARQWTLVSDATKAATVAVLADRAAAIDAAAAQLRTGEVFDAIAGAVPPALRTPGAPDA